LPADAVEFREHRLLELQIFEHGLDDKIDVGK
jgi:hypothetical protein